MIRYYPDIIYQNKHIAEMQKKLGYTDKSASKATLPAEKARGAKGFQNLMNIFRANKPTKREAKKKVPAGSGYGDRLMFGPGWLPRTIGGSAKDLNFPVQYQFVQYNKATRALKNAKTEKDKKRAYHTQQFALGMVQHGLSLADMTDWIYHMCATNPNTISFWYPPLMKAYDQSNHFFKVPKTKIWTLPIEVAQYLQTDYTQTNPKSRDMFNKLCINAFNLDMNKSYFIKTGVFSGKYEFRNAHCKEPDQMGEYFHVINNFAMNVGASTSVDLCVREWISDPEHRPTIYHGMPLRTEFRSFIDFDKKKVIGIVPYWNPIVMDRVLERQGRHNPAILKDYHTYRQSIPFMMKEFNQAVPELREQIGKLIQNAEEPLHGKWSLDIMKSGKDYYLIDMALMANSALKELLPKYHF